MMFNTLLKTSIVDGSTVPDLVDYWETSADSLTFTFYLPQNAVWHDGTPLTADDVVFTFDALLQEGSIAAAASTVASMVKSFRAIDAHTFELVALQASPTFLLNVANSVWILPKHIWESVPVAEWGTTDAATGTDPSKVIGSGPFRFSERVIGDHTSAVRNEAYFDASEVPYIDTYTQRVSPEAASSAQSLVTGESDLGVLQPEQIDIITSGNADVVIHTWDSLSELIVWANQDPEQSSLFTDVKVRQALYYGIDRDLIAEQVFQGLAIRADGTQPVLSNAYDPDQVNTIYTYDPDKANALLDEAGWIDSDGDGIREKDGEKFSFEYLYYLNDQMVPYMQESYRALGIDLVPSKIPFETLVERVMSGDFAMVQLGFGSTNPDGDQGGMFRCDAAPPAGLNIARYCNPDYDALNDAQAFELDPDTRRQMLIDQSNIVNDQAALMFIVFLKLVAGAGPRVHNFVPNGYLYCWSYNKIWLDAE
jgi:peptide/nickel transport system substrate-binding protein